MTTILASVIMPAPSDLDLLRWSLESVRTQTEPAFELIVVDGRHSAATSDEIRRIGDARITYRVGEGRYGADSCMAAGIETARGAVIALLGPGHAFRPGKLSSHLTYLGAHPDVQFTYNDRFNADVDGRTRDLWRAPRRLALADLVMGVPLTASEFVVRRETALRACRRSSGDSSLRFRLLLDGCTSAHLAHPLNVFRPARQARCEPWYDVETLEAVFAQPDCPSEVQSLHDPALSRALLLSSLQAFLEGRATEGQILIRKAIRLDRSLLDRQGRIFFDTLLQVVLDSDADHVERVGEVLDSLPEELAWMTRHRERVYALGHLEKGIRAMCWGDARQGRADIARAVEWGRHWEEVDWARLVQRLNDHESEHGTAATRALVDELVTALREFAPPKALRWFKGMYFANQALRHASVGRHDMVGGDVLRAVMSSPRYAMNRGLWAVLTRAWVKNGSA